MLQNKVVYVFLILLVSLVQSAVQINDDTGSAAQELPDIAFHPNGPAVICWGDSRNGDPDIFMQLYGRRGSTFGVNQKADDDTETSIQTFPRVGMDQYGHFVITWNDYRNGSPMIYAQRFAVNGRKIGPSLKINDNTTWAVQNGPDIDMIPSGQHVITWTDTRSDEFYGDIWAQRFDALGEPIGKNWQVNAESEFQQQRSQVAMLKNGSFMITWLDKRSGQDRIFARAFNAEGEALTDEFLVSVHENDDWRCYRPVIDADVNNNYAILWEIAYDANKADIFCCMYDSAGQQLAGQFKLTDNTPFSYLRDPVISAHPRFPYFEFGFRALKIGKMGMYSDRFALGHTFTPNPETISESDENISFPSIGTADWVNSVYVWVDSRNGEPDIFADLKNDVLVMRTTVGSGFDSKVPISWEPSYGYEDISRYIIYRMETGVSSPEVIATVNPSDRRLPNLMLDYVDHTVENGHEYQYAVMMQDGGDPDRLIFHKATPMADQHILNSKWATQTPIIDGHIDPNEWSDACQLPDIANPSAKEPVQLFIKNDGNSLYVAIDDPNDDFIDPANRMGILFDENFDKQWERSFVLGEGMLTLSQDANAYTPFVGRYPNNLNFGGPVRARGIEFIVSTISGHLQYEAKISLTDSPLNATPGDTIGAAIWIEDPGTFYANGYGNSGEWPLNTLWDAASTLGTLILALYDEPLQTNDWPTLNGNRERNNWARFETELHPPFDYQETMLLRERDKPLVSYRYPYLYGISADSSTAVHLSAFDPKMNQPVWDKEYLYPTVTTFPGLPPSVSDSVLFYSTFEKHYTYDRITGDAIWEKTIPIDEFGSGPIVLDGSRLYGMLDSLFCMDIKTGEITWTMPHTSYHPPILDDRHLFIAGEDTLYKLNKWTGQQVSTFYRPNSDGYVTVDKNAFYTTRNDSLIACNKNDHSILWRYPMPRTYAVSFFNMIAVDDSVLLYCTIQVDGEDGYANLFAFNKQTGEKLWEKIFGDQTAGYPVMANGVVYIYTGIPGEKGSEAIWGYDLVTGDRVFFDRSHTYLPFLIVADGKLFAPFKGGVEIFSNNPIRDDSKVYTVHSPSEYHLWQNYPNPFNPITRLSFTLPKNDHVTLSVFNSKGQLLETLIDKVLFKGSHSVNWNGAHYANGVYFYTLQTKEFSVTKKMVLLK